MISRLLILIVDSQENNLHHQMGMFCDVVVKERFIVSDVPSPLLALGAVLRSGWGVVHEKGSPVRGEKKLTKKET